MCCDRVWAGSSVGMNVALARRMSRVQIPSGPPKKQRALVRLAS